MTAPCFVDANVLVYWRDKADSRKQEIAGTLDAAPLERAVGADQRAGTERILCGFHRKIADALSRDDAWAVVEELFEWNPQPLNEALVGARQGRRRALQLELVGFTDRGCSPVAELHGSVYRRYAARRCSSEMCASAIRSLRKCRKSHRPRICRRWFPATARVVARARRREHRGYFVRLAVNSSPPWPPTSRLNLISSAETTVPV